jgi:5-methylcytosine-specific restriction endonuclease McrA
VEARLKGYRVNNNYLSSVIIEHKFINTVPAMLVTSGNVISAHYLGVASVFNILPKKCTKCGERKSRGEFCKDKSRKDGLQVWCNVCLGEYRKENKERNKAYLDKYQIENKETLRQKDREYRNKNREEISQRRREHYQVNREKNMETSRQYREEYPETHRVWSQKNRARIKSIANLWRKNNPDRVSGYNRTTKARRMSVEGKITAREWNDLKARYNYTCLRCRQQEPEIKLTLDHVLPLVKGGKNVIENAQPLCLSCNCSKKDKHIDYR